MKVIIILAFVVTCTMAGQRLVKSKDPVVENLRSNSHKDNLEGYKVHFDSEGIPRSETGTVKDLGDGQSQVSLEGSISFDLGNGKTYTLNYIADENGFAPEGNHHQLLSQHS